MTSNRRWLILPPAAALLLVLGPLSMRGESAAAERPTANARQPQTPARAQEPNAADAGRNANDANAANGTAVAERTLPALPRTPDLMQVGSTLIGVLLLGGVGLLVLRRLRRGPAPTGGGIVALRQSLRLSPRQVVHALEFEGRLLLVGEGERGVQLLHAQPTPTAAEDEAAVRAAAARLIDTDDDGAVPKNLVLPRPQLQPRPAPAAMAAPAHRAAPIAAPAAGRVATARKTLSDFRALLAKVGR